MGLLNNWLRAVRRAFAPLSVISGIEGSRLANLTTPDRLVIEALILSVNKDYDTWKWRIEENSGEYNDYYTRYCLSHADKNIKIQYKIHYDEDTFQNLTVNSISVDGAEDVIAAYERINNQRRIAQQTADRALEKMKVNEKKWNLAERLLGMKRNEFGALVPAVSVEGEKA